MRERIQRSEPPYAQVAAHVRGQIQSGELQPGDMVPSARKLAEQWRISLATATKVLAALRSEGLVEARTGIGTVVNPHAGEQQATRWPMSGRYSRARAVQGLAFANDVAGEIRKDTVHRDWVTAPAVASHLLGVAAGATVLRRHSRTYVNDEPTEDTVMYFPSVVVQAAPGLADDERIRVVPLLEEAGYRVARTVNEIRARHADQSEQELFGLTDEDIVIEHIHGTYGAAGEALEAVVNVRPAAGNVVTFDTDETPDE